MKRKKWLIPTIIIVLLAIAYFGFIRNTAAPVKELKLSKRVVQRTVSASGTVKSKNQADLAFSSLGRIYSLNIEKGENVEQGDFLASMENYAESETAQSLKDARDIAMRNKDLFIEQYETNKDAVSGADEYEILLRKQNELINQAESSYQAQLGALTRTYIYSPFNGTVIDVFKDKGETAMAGENIIKLADLNELVFEIDLDQEDYVYVKEGMDVDIKLDTYDNEIFKGKVVTLPRYVDSNSDFTLEIEIQNVTSDKILLGMTGDAYIILAETPQEVNSLTFDEIFYDSDDRPYVFVEENGLAKMLYIETGLQGDVYTEITTDITNPIIVSLDDKKELEDSIPVKLSN